MGEKEKGKGSRLVEVCCWGVLIDSFLERETQLSP